MLPTRLIPSLKDPECPLILSLDSLSSGLSLRLNKLRGRERRETVLERRGTIRLPSKVELEVGGVREERVHDELLCLEGETWLVKWVWFASEETVVGRCMFSACDSCYVVGSGRVFREGELLGELSCF